MPTHSGSANTSHFALHCLSVIRQRNWNVKQDHVLHTLFQEAIGQIRAPAVCAVVNPRHLHSRNLRNYGQRGTAEFWAEGEGRKRRTWIGS